MRRLRFYVLRQMTLAASMTVAGLTLAIWLSQSLRLLDVIVNRGLSVGLALKFLMLLLPGLIALLLPASPPARYSQIVAHRTYRHRR